MSTTFKQALSIDRQHSWERTALNGDGGTGDYYEWACRTCDRREWSSGIPERSPDDPGCAIPRAKNE